MRKTVLYIAMSLDGYIADQSGGVEWLAGENPEDNETDTYSEFIKDVDTVIMGWNTYEQIVTELSPDTWVYAGLTSYVITHREVETKKDVIFTQEDPCTLIENLRKIEVKKQEYNIIVPSSTAGSNASCCNLLNLCISSINKILFPIGFNMKFFVSSTTFFFVLFNFFVAIHKLM